MNRRANFPTTSAGKLVTAFKTADFVRLTNYYIIIIIIIIIKFLKKFRVG